MSGFIRNILILLLLVVCFLCSFSGELNDDTSIYPKRTYISLLFFDLLSAKITSLYT